MKVAIITNTCYEEIIPLSKHLSSLIELDLFVVISSKGSGKGILFESEKLWLKEKPGIIENIERKGYVDSLFKQYINDKIKIHALYFASLAFFMPLNVWMAIKMAVYFKIKKYDLIHFNVPSGLYIIFKLIVNNIPFVVTTHDPVPHKGENYISSRIIRNFLNVNNSTEHILHSHLLLKDFYKSYPRVKRNKISVIYYGSHEWLKSYSERDPEEKSNTIIFFGRISPYKGIEYLLQSVSLLHEEFPWLKVIIAGSGKIYFDDKLILDNPVVEIMNRYIPNRELAELITKSICVVCPYTEATQSGVIMSAFALNKPVIATMVGGIPDVVENNVTGILVPPKDPFALAKAIKTLISDNEKLSEMSKNIQNTFNRGKFSWENIAEQTFNVYKKHVKK